MATNGLQAALREEGGRVWLVVAHLAVATAAPRGEEGMTAPACLGQLQHAEPATSQPALPASHQEMNRGQWDDPPPPAAEGTDKHVTELRLALRPLLLRRPVRRSGGQVPN